MAQRNGYLTQEDSPIELGSSIRVLILEDSASDAALLARKLVAAGFSIDHRVVSNRTDFQECLAWEPDVILADYHVPGFGAPAAVDLVRHMGSPAPVIVVSGAVDEEVVARLIKAGASDYLMKDRLTRLGPAVSNAIREWKLERDKAAAEANRAKTAAKLQAIVEKLTDAVLSVTADLRVETANPAADRMFGRDGELRGESVRELLVGSSGGPAALEFPRLNGLPHWTEGRSVRQDGTTFFVEWCLSSIGQDSALVVVRDITRRKSVMAALRSKALTDPLTKLHNRAVFLDRLEHAVADQKRSGATRAVLMIDMNGFKAINYTHGHLVGDEVLREVARRLRHALRATDTVARLGGDEFGILLAGHTSTAHAIGVARKIETCLRSPVTVDRLSVHIGSSIGLALCPDDGCNIEDLLEHADEAMYFAKRNDTGVSRLETTRAPSLREA
jgi:diguanylate cyclase (GGDEF)-like protein/PAS domain S-box-containing protein